MSDSLLTDTTLALLSNTSDSQVAADLADALLRIGRTPTLSRPKVAFPPQWVKRVVTKGPTELAAFALANCDDPVLLSYFATRDKHRAVRLALSANPAMPEPVRLAMSLSHESERRSTREDLLARQLALPQPWTPSQHLELLLGALPRRAPLLAPAFDVIEQIIELIRADPTSATADASLLGVSQRGYDFLARSYLATYYRIPPGGNDSLWEMATVSPAQVLLALPKHYRRSFLLSLLAQVSLPASIGVPYGRDLAEIFVSVLNPRDVFWPKINRVRNFSYFTDDALDLFLDLPTKTFVSWAWVLAHHDLDPDRAHRFEARLEKIISTTPALLSSPATLKSIAVHETLRAFREARRERYASMNPDMVRNVLVHSFVPIVTPAVTKEQLDESFVPHRVVEAFLVSSNGPFASEVAQQLIRYLDDPNDPFVAQIIELTSPKELLKYLLGDWYLQGNVPLLPDPAQVPGLVARILNPEPTPVPNSPIELPSFIDLPFTASDAYYEVLLDSLPGSPASLIRDERAAKIIHDRLSSADPTLLVALEQFVIAAPGATLPQICSTVRHLTSRRALATTSA